MKYILSFNSIQNDTISFTGGKGSSLVRLKKAGLPVPDGFIILSSSFEQNELIPVAKAELHELISHLSEKYTYAVRSSALNEDGDQASFAGAYETVIDVPTNGIEQAVTDVLNSVNSDRVRQYTDSMKQQKSEISVIIQKFIKAEFAGVLFTSNIITGSSCEMQGNYVKGNGEDLVSGSSNAEDLLYHVLKYTYLGPDEFKRYAKQLYRAAIKIRELYGCPMDIEWAAADGHLYILQARPITTLRGMNHDTFQINNSLSGEYLFSKTNVGEIFMRPVSPMTFSVLEPINDLLGVPQFIDFICGQAYCNISVVCSLLVSFGLSKEKAYSMIASIAGNLPENVDIPIFPVKKSKFLSCILKLLFTGSAKRKPQLKKSVFIEQMGSIADQMIQEIRSIGSNEALLDYWHTSGYPFISRVLGAIISSLNVNSLLSTQKKLSKIAGDDLANALISGCSGNLESMKPLLMLEDVISGKITREEYIKKCGHRHVNEMELSCPYPYENPHFPQNLIDEHILSGANVHQMKQHCENQFEQARSQFIQKYPEKEKWLNKLIVDYSKANHTREDLRSKALKLFCMLREFLLKAALLNDLNDDIFMLYFPEVLRLLEEDLSVLDNIPIRRQNYNRYLTYPSFPNVIRGRFVPDKWINSENRRLDFYSESSPIPCASDIKGFAGAAGQVTGKVRVILDLSDADLLQKGEILVTTATNIGWTILFPRASAIVTDIGAPLSHAAIVAREFGIPAVVGCSNATTLLHTGDMVSVDGSNGTVKKIS